MYPEVFPIVIERLLKLQGHGAILEAYPQGRHKQVILPDGSEEQSSTVKSHYSKCINTLRIQKTGDGKD
jgi:hypothetical protein